MFDSEAPRARARRRVLFAIVALAAAVYAAIFGYAAISPIANEGGPATSPLTLQHGIDFAFYYDFAQRLAQSGADPGMLAMARNGDRWPVPGLVLPTLLLLFDYQEGHTLPLALLFLVLGIGFSATWLWWLWRQDVAPVALALFAVLPGPVWLALNISSDMPFAVAVAAFALAYFGTARSTLRWAVVAAALALAILVRPNGIFLCLFLFADAGLRVLRGSGRSGRSIVVVALGAALAAVLGYYYYPYLLSYLDSSQGLSYFGIDQADYLAGAFAGWPAVLDLPASWAALLAAKMLYFAGLRPSYGDTSTLLVVVRAAPGMILLPGLIWLFLRAPLGLRLFVGIYLLPLVLGAAQDRYNLPIMPFLFYYGIAAWARAWARLRTVTGPVSHSDVRPRL